MLLLLVSSYCSWLIVRNSTSSTNPLVGLVTLHLNLNSCVIDYSKVVPSQVRNREGQVCKRYRGGTLYLISVPLVFPSNHLAGI